MKDLKELCKDFEYEVLTGSMEGSYTEFVTDNRKLTAGCVYVCIKGANFDGHTCVRQAVLAKAALIVVEKPLTELDVPEDTNGCTIIRTDSTRRAMAYISCAHYDYPSKDLFMIGITGTKGKTTTTYMLREIFRGAGSGGGGGGLSEGRDALAQGGVGILELHQQRIGGQIGKVFPRKLF